MNYTEIYRKVYAELQNDGLPHEAVHKSAISICEAISNLWLMTNKSNSGVLNAITDIMKDLYKKDLNITS